MPADHSSPEESKLLALSLGRAIRKIREEQGLSQEKFAELTGHHRTYVGFLERGEKMPTVHTIHKIAQALDMTLTGFFRKAGL